jgi:signal transduction histidine kinase
MPHTAHAAHGAPAAQSPPPTQHAAHAAYAGEIAATIEGALHFTRDLARSLSTQSLGQPDLPTALADLAATTEKMFGVTCAFHHDANLPLPAGDSSEHLYRLAQEAINNAVRHGRASHIDILWQSRIGRQVLRIRDNGRGFDPDAVAVPKAGRANDAPHHRERDNRGGIGLRVMRHRAQMVGGQLQIGRADTGGTIVACEFSA